MVDSPLTNQFHFEKAMVHGSSFTLFPKPTSKKRKTMADYAKKRIVLRLKSKKKRKMTKLPKKVKIKTLEARLKKVLYPLIKKRDKGVCISSGQRGLVGRNYQAGHYIKAELCNLIYRYDLRNINGQRSYDNLYLRGNAPAYRKGMIKKWGIKVVEELEKNYNKPLPMDFNEREYLLGLIKKYGHMDKSSP